MELIYLYCLKSRPYVNMTCDIMAKFGVKIENEFFVRHEDCDRESKNCRIDEFKIPKQEYKSCDYVVEGDYSSASYLLAACFCSNLYL